MKVKKLHLIWIIPICLVIGSLTAGYTMSWFFETTLIGLTEKTTEKLEDCMIAWEEDPLSNHRILSQGEFCYLVPNQPITRTNYTERIVCPKRELSFS